jgi:hypothetical protein
MGLPRVPMTTGVEVCGQEADSGDVLVVPQGNGVVNGVQSDEGSLMMLTTSSIASSGEAELRLEDLGRSCTLGFQGACLICCKLGRTESIRRGARGREEDWEKEEGCGLTVGVEFGRRCPQMC